VIATATLNGHRVTEARLFIPAWGASYHDVSVDGEVTLSGSVTLAIADLTVQGTILSGGAAAGRSFFRVVAGAAGWGKIIPRKAYANDLGVKLATVLGDAAATCGETLDASTVDQAATLGPSWVRPEGPACRVLERVSPSAWYVGEDGKTRLGARTASTLSVQATRVSQINLARGTLTLASETIAGILPGVVVDGLTAVDVEHEVSEKGGLRTKLWGKRGGSVSRRLSAWRAIIDQMDPDRLFRGVWEYRVVTQVANRLNLQPVRVSNGMPDLSYVYVRPGVSGCKAQVALGERVLVGFVDADPGRPVVLAHEDADGPGFVPTSLSLAGGGPAVGRVGDSVSVTFDATAAGHLTCVNGASPTIAPPTGFTLTGTITSGSGKVTSG
jgi:hypothetical protein